MAVGTSSPETARKAAEAHGLSVDKAYSSPEAIADDKDVDLVVVSVKVCCSHLNSSITSRVAYAASTYLGSGSQKGCEPVQRPIPIHTL